MIFLCFSLQLHHQLLLWALVYLQPLEALIITSVLRADSGLCLCQCWCCWTAWHAFFHLVSSSLSFSTQLIIDSLP